MSEISTRGKDRSLLVRVIFWILVALGATVVVNILFGGWFSFLGTILVVGFWVLVGYLLRGYMDRRKARQRF